MNPPEIVFQQPAKVAHHIERLSETKSVLHGEDKVTYSTADGDISFNMAVNIAVGEFEKVLTREEISSRETMLLKVKKPDYLGHSRWECQFEGRSIEVRIKDEAWLTQFQNRQIDVRPGDALRVEILKTVKYSHDNDVVRISYEAERILEVRRPEEQTQLLLPG